MIARNYVLMAQFLAEFKFDSQRQRRSSLSPWQNRHTHTLSGTNYTLVEVREG